ncbi:hemagglutinin/proteinase-like [Haliotis asinina]|uniref:hemagglutinin/proteinase-like n=1 Tax=Haliotis asinina TaxID=109174 RepID=UPI0035324DF0
MKSQIILLGLVSLAVYTTEAARRFNVASVAQRLRSRFHATREELCAELGLHGKSAIVPRQSLKTVRGRVKQRLQQIYGGLEVVGGSVAVDVDRVGYTGVVSGELFTSLEEDIPNPDDCEQTHDTVKRVAFAREGVTESQVSKLRVTKNVYVKKDGVARLAYEINFFYMNGKRPSRPCYFIDACDLTTLHRFNNIQNKAVERRLAVLRHRRQSPGDDECSGETTTPEPETTTDSCDGGSETQDPQTAPPTTAAPTTRSPTTAGPTTCNNPARGEGGNLKVGRYLYGDPPLCLNTTVRGSSCILENAYVKVIDLNQGTRRNNRDPAASYTCANGYDDAINQAYSPVLDAMNFGTKSARMFIEWYSMVPLNFKPILFVHYGSNYENAFWDGDSLTFGDGRYTFYPLVNQDVIAHELAHGVTEQNSNLIYDDQSGGINEAFSDITGEATEMFARGYNDWFVGAEIFKSRNGALRYFEDPTRDGVSIKHTRDYRNSVDVHYSSGIFNHAFYQLVQENNMPIRQAFECFLRANVIYWGRSTTFEEGACGVMKACYDLGYDYQAVKRSFQVVGVTFRGCQDPTFMETLSESETLTGLTVSSSHRPVFLLAPPSEATYVVVTPNTGGNSINMAVYDNLESTEPLAMATGQLRYQLPSGSPSLYLRVSADVDNDITDVSVQITYE